ncbi:hypothetical protein GCM10027088_43650 [Nocardia goodfellowii]
MRGALREIERTGDFGDSEAAGAAGEQAQNRAGSFDRLHWAWHSGQRISSKQYDNVELGFGFPRPPGVTRVTCGFANVI